MFYVYTHWSTQSFSTAFASFIRAWQELFSMLHIYGYFKFLQIDCSRVVQPRKLLNTGVDYLFIILKNVFCVFVTFSFSRRSFYCWETSPLLNVFNFKLGTLQLNSSCEKKNKVFSYLFNKNIQKVVSANWASLVTYFHVRIRCKLEKNECF